MFGKKRRALEKRLDDLEWRVGHLEIVKTPEYGNIPTSQLWQYIDRLIAKKIKSAASGK